MYTKASAADGKTICDILRITKEGVLDPFTTLLTAVAAFFFLWGAIEFIAGASDEKARTTGKTHMMWGIFGLVIMAVAKIIITILQNFFEIGVPGGSLCTF